MRQHGVGGSALVWAVVACAGVAAGVGAGMAGGGGDFERGQPGTPPETPGSQPVNPPADAKPADAKPADAKLDQPKPIKAEIFSSLSVRSIGPALMSGRIADLAVRADKPSEFYVGVASGNLWKTTDGGVTFNPVFDSYGSYAIGTLRLDPNNHNVLWVGTGENKSQRSVSWGDGLYVTRDGGKSFTHVGFKDSKHIGMIQVDPRDSNTVYVAVMGNLWEDSDERGVYKTTDGGKTWERILFVSPRTGFNDIKFDPRNPDRLYATAYQRRRHEWTLINGGPESGFYRSEDAGKTWRKITTGLPAEDKGRIGLAVSPANPDILYAIMDAGGVGEGKGGVYRSTDRGETWERRSGYNASSPQYYHELVAHPTDPDTVYAMDTFMGVSTDGGKSFSRVPLQNVHVDSHCLWINPANPSHMIQGNDGGVYETHDGVNWRFCPNLPITQFYRVAADNSWPFYYVYGGTQDNNTQGGPSRTNDEMGIANEHWFITVGGDGFEPAIDPDDPNIVYSQWQHGGLIRFDRKSGEQVDIKPREAPGEAPYVWNWDSPLLISPHKGTRLYFGSRKVHRSDDRGDSWTVISPDLTRQLDRNQLKVFGVVQKPDAPSKHVSTSIYGNLVSLAESPLAEGLLYAGSDDGLIHVSSDAGANWKKYETFPEVPTLVFVADLEPSRHSADRVYAAFDNHRSGDFRPYLFRSDDRGATWKSIAGDLPAVSPVYTIAEDHVNPDLLFVGTERGAFFTLDGGKVWKKIGGLPTIEVRDIEIQRRDNDLILATFGRGFYILDDYTPMRHATAEMLDKEAVIFPVRKALSYVEQARLGGTNGRGWSGANFYSAPNPPFGAVFTVHIKEKYTNRKERRKEAEKKEGWTYPTIDQFREEDREQDPQVWLTVRDSAGAVVRRLTVPRDAGLHRVAWDLRYPVPSPVSLSAAAREPWDVDRGGVLAPPGRYTAQLSKIIDGVATDIGEPVAFEVEDVNFATFAAKGQARTEKHAFEMKVAALQRAAEGASRVLGEVEGRLPFLRQAIRDTVGLDATTLADHEALRLRVNKVRVALSGDPTLGKRVEPEPPSILERISNVAYGLRGVTSPPTGTQRQQYEHAASEFEKALAELKTIIEQDLRALEGKLEKAGAPWTPGRLPEWVK